MNIIVVGAGNIAQAHVDSLRALDANITAVCTRSERGKAFAEKNNIPHWGTHLEGLMDAHGADGVYLLTQPSAYPHLLPALQERDTPVFLEKPLAATLDGARQLLDYLPSTVFVGLNRRFYGHIQWLKQELQGKTDLSAVVVLPERLKDYAHREDDTVAHWPMLNGIHVVDLMCYLLGYPAHRLADVHWGAIELPGERGRLPFAQYHQVMFETHGGHHVQFMANFDSPGGWRIHIFGPQVEYILSPLEQLQVKTLSGLDTHPVSDGDTQYKPGFLAQSECFLKGVQQFKSNPQGYYPPHWVTYDQAIRSMAVLEEWIPCEDSIVRTPQSVGMQQ